MTTRLSIIVPIYNVEKYLAECLDSIRNQTFADFEAIMVDDGSPDGSRAIAADYASRDPRFRLVTRENGGLAAARNTGIAAISDSSEFIAFVDSDDLVTPRIFELMIASLDKTGSDFASCNVHRLTGSRRWQSPMFRPIAARDRAATHIRRFGGLTADRIACNKVFRRDFWERNGFRFPEGRLYEDIPIIMRAHYLATAVDIISAVGYVWRVTEGSITASRASVRGVQDRVRAISEIRALLTESDDVDAPRLRRAYERSTLTDDLRYFLDVLPEGSAEYQAAFMEHAGGYAASLDPAIITDLPAELRLTWTLVCRQRLAEVLAILSGENGASDVAITGARRKTVTFPALSDPTVGLSPDERRIDPALKGRCQVTHIESADGALTLRGSAWIDRIGYGVGLTVLVLREISTHRRIVVMARRWRSDDADRVAGNAGGFTWRAKVRLRWLRGRRGWEESIWQVGAGIATHGLLRATLVNTKSLRVGTLPSRIVLDADHSLDVLSEQGHLRLQISRQDPR